MLEQPNLKILARLSQEKYDESMKKNKTLNEYDIAYKEYRVLMQAYFALENLLSLKKALERID